MNKEKKQSIIEYIATQRAKLPSSSQYTPIDKSSIQESRKIYHAIYKTAKKTTLAEFIEKEEKKKLGPVAYDPSYTL